LSALVGERHGCGPSDDGEISLDALEPDNAAALAVTDRDEAEERLHLAQSAALVAGELGKLPAEYREVLVLRELEDLPYREIAEVLGVPIGTVMSRLARGRRLLRKALAEDARSPA
jgi:RNA polymerase sigma-70 factor (ECF subfamily)